MSRSGQPSIYIRLMPLMHALIGASAAMFLNTLFCGRPVSSQANRCRPSRAAPKTVAGAAPSAPSASRPATRPVSTDAGRPGPHATPSVDATPSAVAAPVAETAERRLAAAIRPCVRPQARSFRLGLRLLPDGKVRRVFVPRDPGVNAAMVACIQRRLAGASLPAAAQRGDYLEWRLRQAAGQLSLTLVRPAPASLDAGEQRLP